VKEKRFTVTSVADIAATHNRAEGWHVEFDGPESGLWTELSRSVCAIAPQAGEEAIFTYLDGIEIASFVTVGGRLYVRAAKLIC
jgi:hypothetical protein